MIVAAFGVCAIQMTYLQLDTFRKEFLPEDLFCPGSYLAPGSCEAVK